MKSKSFIFPIIILTILLQGCIFEYPNCPEDPWKHVTVHFDTSLCPDADPEGMALFLYPEGGGEPWRFDFSGTQGDSIDIPEGLYSLIAYNNDTFRVSIRDRNDFDLCSFTTPETNVFEPLTTLTRSGIPGAPPDGSQLIKREPQKMWCGVIDSVRVFSDNTVAIGETVINKQAASSSSIITVPLRNATANISVEISPVENIDDIRYLSAVLTGMNAEYLCHNYKPTGPLSAIPFAMNRKSPSSNTLTGSLRTFGKKTGTDAWVILYIWLLNGEKYYYRFNVTQLIDNAPDPFNITLQLGSIRIPESIGDETTDGIDVGVDGWDFVIIDLES